MSRWSERTDVPRGASYDERWRELEAKGVSIHGEADLVAWLAPGGSVLDAGCGTGRVAIELARRGHEIVGVDLVEVAPAYDPGGVTGFLAAQVLLNFLGYIFHTRGV